MIDVVLPSGESESSGNTVGKWFRSVGDPVRKDDPLLEIITDKVTVEIAAPADGELAEILKPEGEQVEPGEAVGRIETGGGAGGGAAEGRGARGNPQAGAGAGGGGRGGRRNRSGGRGGCRGRSPAGRRQRPGLHRTS